ncbi:MAG: hypothetical protein ACKVX7_03390 [Planctomycetota bacterium]
MAQNSAGRGAPTQAARPATSKKQKSADLDSVYATFVKTYGPLAEPTPTETLDVLFFALMMQDMGFRQCAKAFQTFKSQYVDWNEVRISGATELQEVLKGAGDPLALALTMKEFLNRLFIEHHHVGIEFLHGKTATEVKNFFKKSPKIPDAVLSLILERNNDTAIFPLSAPMAEVVERLGWVDAGATVHKKSKDIYTKIPRPKLLEYYCYLLEHSRAPCTQDRDALDCPACDVRAVCPYPKKSKGQKATAKKSKR